MSILNDTALRRGAPPLHPIAREFGLQILVVEDDEADAYLIERALSNHPRVGSVLRASDGIEALELLEEGVAPDLVIIDLHMPRKDGFSLLVELGCAGSAFPMVVLTSSTAPSDAIRSKLRGADTVLTKPDSIEDLRKLLTIAVAAI
ncbi:MAG: response regulator [Terricaulis sp.]